MTRILGRIAADSTLLDSLWKLSERLGPSAPGQSGDYPSSRDKVRAPKRTQRNSHSRAPVPAPELQLAKGHYGYERDLLPVFPATWRTADRPTAIRSVSDASAFRMPVKKPLKPLTTEHREAPTQVGGATVETSGKTTAWDEAGKLGAEDEARSSTTGSAGGQTKVLVQEQHQRVEIQFCPDAGGISSATWEWSLTTTTVVSSAGAVVGSGRQKLHFLATATGHVNDDAELTGFDMEIKTDLAEGKRPGPGEVVMKQVMSARAQSKGYTPTPDVREGTIIEGEDHGIQSWKDGELELQGVPANAQELLAKGETMASTKLRGLYAAARERWRQDRCVEVEFTEGRTPHVVQPADQVRIVAESKHREDGDRLSAPLAATLYLYHAVTPNGKRIPPPAVFTYTAPAAKTDEAAEMKVKGEAEVWVTSISRRGIGHGKIGYELGGEPGYLITVHVLRETEKYGRVLDLTYKATVRELKNPSEGLPLGGNGTYTGQETIHEVNCHDDIPDQPEEYVRKGKLKAQASADALGEMRLMSYTLATLDWTRPHLFTGQFRSLDEKAVEEAGGEEAAASDWKGAGTVGGFVELKGRITEKRNEETQPGDDCTGAVRIVTEERVEELK